MSVSRNESEGRRHSPELDNEIEHLHQSVVRVLGGTLTRDYLLSPDEAQELVQQAICTYLQARPAGEAEPWVISVVCAHAEKLYRKRAGQQDVPDAAKESARIRDLLELLRRLEILAPDARTAVRLHAQRWSDEDIAAEMNVTVKYVRLLVRELLKKLR